MASETLESGPRLQREPEGQLSQMPHVWLLALLLDVFQSFHLGGKRKTSSLWFIILKVLINQPYCELRLFFS